MSIINIYKAPKYKDVSFKDIQTLEQYFHWHDESKPGGKYEGLTFKKAYGLEMNLSDDVLKYYYRYYKKNGYLIEFLFDLVRYYQVLFWMRKNVNDNEKEVREIPKNKIIDLLNDCSNVSLDVSLAETLLPVPWYEDKQAYGKRYLFEVRAALGLFTDAITATDFETEAVYYEVFLLQ